MENFSGVDIAFLQSCQNKAVIDSKQNLEYFLPGKTFDIVFIKTKYHDSKA